MRFSACLFFWLLLGSGPHVAADILYHVTDFGTLGGSNSYAYGINDRGQVVGYSETYPYNTHAFLYNNGQMRDLNDLIDPTLGIRLGSARGINDRGQILADNYLLTPIPEPDTLALFGVALLGLEAAWVRRSSLL